jgi:glucose/arabinose dehydrogenase
VGRSRNRISLIRNGVRHTLVENLKQPLGMVVKDGFLYVGNTDSIVRFPFKVGDLKISAPAEKLIDLPAGG